MSDERPAALHDAAAEGTPPAQLARGLGSAAGTPAAPGATGRPAGPGAAGPATPPGERHFLRAFPPKELVAHRARNAEVWSEDGRRYLDVGGASHGVALVGHNHPHVVAAVHRQADLLLHVAQTIPNRERGAFLDRLHARLPQALSHTFLANSGTEAVECALKLAVAATGRPRLVAAQQSFHGRSSGALSATHRAEFRKPFSPLLAPASFVAYNDEEALKEAVSAETAAVVLEPVQGEGGVRAANASYLKAARDLCDDRGAVLVFDEVQSGLGRTGHFLASSHAGIVPDALLLAKGLAGGLPVGTCSVTQALAAKLPPGGHGSTYGGNPLACAAGAAVLDVLRDERLAERARELGPRVVARLRSLASPLVRDVRGLGLMVGIELRIRPQPVLQQLHARGILALTGGTTGIRLLPPLTMPREQLDETLDALAEVLEETAGAHPAGTAPAEPGAPGPGAREA
ncbi:MAG TPA: aspartate aminotransferase family protein [Candidatus Thermoplasmatota archaeon]|nr:aspartate aminotransferase family protein [Candidatus Thermoplasmatota archaeon]